ncbi:MPN domain-containing protein CG4751 [Trichonephila clavipes]|nr:MPN domain-containing protein CG4751 [Trichonephila clavipes]
MVKSIARKRKRQFYGNKFTNTSKKNSTSAVHECTASCSKLGKESFSTAEEMPGPVFSNRIVDLELIVEAFSQLCCPKCFAEKVELFEDSRYGLCSHFTLKLFSDESRFQLCSDNHRRRVWGRPGQRAPILLSLLHTTEALNQKLWSKMPISLTAGPLCSSLEGSQAKGRPSTRWLDDIEKDLNTLKIKNWKRVAINRERLKDHGPVTRTTSEQGPNISTPAIGSPLSIDASVPLLCRGVTYTPQPPHLGGGGRTLDLPKPERYELPTPGSKSDDMMEEDEARGHSGDEEEEEAESGVDSLEEMQKRRSIQSGRGVTLSMLMSDGILEAGEGFLTIDYLGAKFVGDLLPGGKIRAQETQKIFSSPSSWAIHCKKLLNPDKKSGCGWSSMRYKGKKLDTYKNLWFRKHKQEQENSQLSSPSTSNANNKSGMHVDHPEEDKKRIIGRLECGRTQLEVSEELGIAQSVISRLWQRFQDDGNVSRCYSTGRPRVTTPNEGRYLAVTAKRNRRSTASDLSRQLSSATGTTDSRQIVYRRLGHIGLYARRPVRCVPLTATHCLLRLTWSREHALWTPQQWSCVMFSNESRFSLLSDSRRTLIWKSPGTRYHQENTIERHRYGGAGWLLWGGIILGSRNDLHVQSVTITGHIYRDVILEQHVRLFRGAMGAEFLFMDDNARPHRASIVDKCLQSEDITRMDWPAYSPDLNLIEHVWDMLGRRIAARQPPPTCLPELQRALLDEWCNIPEDQIDNLILSMPSTTPKKWEIDKLQNIIPRPRPSPQKRIIVPHTVLGNRSFAQTSKFIIHEHLLKRPCLVKWLVSGVACWKKESRQGKMKIKMNIPPHPRMKTTLPHQIFTCALL